MFQITSSIFVNQLFKGIVMTQRGIITIKEVHNSILQTFWKKVSFTAGEQPVINQSTNNK